MKTLPEMKPMVGWYDPRQLAKTGIEVAISTIFGRHSDQRLVEAMASGDAQEKKFFDYTCYYTDDGKEICKPDPTRPRLSIWIDYVGDVGDGWNSTYGVASQLAKSDLPVAYTDTVKGKTPPIKTQRGDLLVFGGDEVYPTASRESYKERLLSAYNAALPDSGTTPPHVFAVPGNHDWYDSLVAFTRLFTARPWFAGWRTRQRRSYFALKLPHNWWLLGTDVQLGSDIDAPQMAYFESLTPEMESETLKTNKPASIILCHAEPHWIRAVQYGGIDPNYSESNLKILEKRLGQNVAVFIAGDLHHYRRHESLDKATQKITAGGGGAFLHPTHPGVRGTKFDTIVEKGLANEERKFTLKGCFPSTKDSQRLCWLNLVFPYLKGNMSWSFGFVTAVLYLVLAFPLLRAFQSLTINGVDMPYVTYTAIRTIYHSPLSLLLLVLTIVGFIFFTDTHHWVYRLIMGGLHAIAHILAAFAVGLISIFLVWAISTPAGWLISIPWFRNFQFYFDLRVFLAIVPVLLLGFVVGSFIMGAYLLISMNFFGRHGNEAFSSLGIQDWKNFLRLHIDGNGTLTIYPIGIKRVPRKWKAAVSGSGPSLESNDPRATAPELIEMPVFMQKVAGTDTGVRSSSPEQTPIAPAEQSSGT